MLVVVDSGGLTHWSDRGPLRRTYDDAMCDPPAVVERTREREGGSE